MTVKLSDFDYDLPKRFIAQTPTTPRDTSNLLIYNRAAQTTKCKHFRDIVDYLRAGDVLVINNTRVIPARLFGMKESTAANIELLLVKKLSLDTYETLVKPLKRLKVGDNVLFARPRRPDELAPCDIPLMCSLVSKNETDGTAVVRFNATGAELDNLLEQLGTMPLPHYITKKLTNPEKYQTVYNKTPGSAAAPTAGLHWTPELMQRTRDKGVIFAEILLHVGLGTFRPVKTEDITAHKMHSEHYEITPAAADIINTAKREGRRVICVGTTALRTLESAAADRANAASQEVPGVLASMRLRKWLHKTCSGCTGRHPKNFSYPLRAQCAETDIFIYPPYEFRITDALITNFHLPKSTLLMLVSAFLGENGREKALELYELAKRENFRFFSFGDAMFIT